MTAWPSPSRSRFNVPWAHLFGFTEKGTGRGVAQQVRVTHGDQFMVEGVG